MRTDTLSLRAWACALSLVMTLAVPAGAWAVGIEDSTQTGDPVVARESDETATDDQNLIDSDSKDKASSDVMDDETEDPQVDHDETPATESNADETEAQGAPDEPSAVPEPEPDPDPKEQIVADGVYLIRTGLGNQLVIDSAGTQAVPKTNVQQATYSGATKQAWHITFNKEKGLYQIWRKTASGGRAVLEVESAGTANGTNVRLWYDNGSTAQWWDIVPFGSGYRIVSALKLDFSLDVRSASNADGTNIQMYKSAETKAQRFFLYPTSPSVPTGSKTVDEGTYELVCTLPGGTGNVADVKGGSNANDANVRMYKSNKTIAQRFHLSYDGAGSYEVACVGSGRVLEAAGGGLLPSTNVRQHSSNGTKAQRWVVRKNSNGTYSFINCGSGMALDISGASASSGANLQLYTDNGSVAQQFNLGAVDPINTGIVTIGAFSSTGQVFDIKGGSAKAGAAAQLWRSNATLAQRFELVKVGTGEYRIRAAASGGWLTAGAVGAQVTQQGNHATSVSAANTWRCEWASGKMVLVNKANGAALTMKDGKTANGTTLITSAKTGAAAQRFVFTPADLLNTGCFFVQSLKGPYLDISGDSTAAGANVQVWSKDKSGGQYFYVQKSGSAYKLKNANSSKFLTASGDGQRANVAQQASSSSDRQRWKAQISDGGGVSLICVASGRALDIAGGSTKNGANVQIYSSNQSAAQTWKFSKTTYLPYTGYMLRAVNTANASSSTTSYLIIVDKSNHKTIVMTGGNGNWKPYRTMTVTVGAYATPTVEGSFVVGSRGYSFGSGYTCYYWTQFYNDYLFHSVLYNEGTRVIQDGRLGYHLSHGCVRMDINDAYWIYSNIPSGTRVIVYS